MEQKSSPTKLTPAQWEKVTNDMLTLASQMSVNKESKSASEESNKKQFAAKSTSA